MHDRQMYKRLRKFLPSLIISTSWGLVMAVGFTLLFKYESSSAPLTASVSKWPVQSALGLALDCPTLVMVAHPKCPCTRASISELSTLMTRYRGKVKAYVLFLKPDDTEPDWEKTDLWESASIIPGVTVLADVNGKKAECFAARTSGQTMLYSSNGRLLFDGGVTGMRGHVGDNTSLDALQIALERGGPELRTTKTYGCSLIDDRELKSEEVKPWPLI